jgi:uncharacterized protein (TIGR00299 family) protein
MKTIYLDIFSGISGDMFLGALLDLGADLHRLEDELGKLSVGGYHLHVAKGLKAAIAGTKFTVHLEHEHQNHGHAPSAEHHAPEAEKEHGDEHGHQHHSHAAPHHQRDQGHLRHDFDHGHEHAHTLTHKDDHTAHGRTFAEIRKLIQGSTLSPWVIEKSVAIFQRIADAEGRIHGRPAEKVHFHEVGAVDSIVDIVGACIALELLGKPRLLSASVVEGFGWIQCAHGRFPIPAPATLQILSARGVSITQCNEPHELVTPTGAAILAELVESFGPMKDLVPNRIGFGLGTRDNHTRPNVLRAVLGETVAAATSLDWESDQVVTLQTNLDDLNSEILGRFMELAMTAGALDVFYTPIQMKKSRPGVLLNLLCSEADADRFTELLLRETSAFGVRRFTSERRKLRREVQKVETSFGPVDVKLGKLNGQVVQASPEYESCKAAAERAGVPLKQIYEAAIRSARV